MIQGPGDLLPALRLGHPAHFPQPDGTVYPDEPAGLRGRGISAIHRGASAIVNGVAGVLGCKARLTDTRSGKSVDCVVADTGPSTKTGEASIAAAKALGIQSSARSGGEEKPVFTYELWPGVAAVVNGVTYPLQHS